MTSTRHLLLACSLGLCAAGCFGQQRASLFGGQAHLERADYPHVLGRWTRSDQVYRGLDTQMFVTATFHSPELRRAFAVAFPEIYGHGGSITRRELVDLTGDVEQFHNFFLAVYTAEDKWNDLALSDSIWHVTLIGSDDVLVDPAAVEPVKIDANLREVYPYITRFDRAYLVRFPLTDATHRLVLDGHSTRAVLRIASALGSATMRWDLEPMPGERAEQRGIEAGAAPLPATASPASAPPAPPPPPAKPPAP